VENQHNKPSNNKSISKELLEYRSQIDKIDLKLIDLLNQRMSIVKQVGAHKKAVKDRFFIRSNREADMIKNLLSKVSEDIPKPIIVSIWRKIITCANIIEQDIRIGIHNPKKSLYFHSLIREYYSDLISIIDYSSSNNVILEIEKNNIQLGIFSINSNVIDGNSDHWWVNISNSKNGLKVFAKIPFIEHERDKNIDKDELFVVAIKDAEESNDDKTLMVLELNNDYSAGLLQKSLIEFGFKAKIIKNVKLKEVRSVSFYLIEIDGFYTNESDAVREISQSKLRPHIKIIGNYPTPIKL
jgi:chorismate mutase